ncbi:hypothetical protein NE865_12917 [Phthorimaea operculella]|nr:hypothetical protein NE865_12917 [Phthorimaea operculella]
MDGIAKMFDSKFIEFRRTLLSDIQTLIDKKVNAAFLKLKSEFSETTDFLEAGQKDLNLKVINAESTVKSLEQQNTKLQTDLRLLQRRLESIEKISRSYNIEIQAVPEKKNENIINIVKKLYDTVGLPITVAEISTCRRVAKLPTTAASRPRNILVTLPSTRHRDALLSAVRRFNKSNAKEPLHSHHLGLEGDKRQIYVVKHLSPECKELHAETRKAAKGKFKFTWVKYGNVYVRKDENSPVIHIKNKDTLVKIM